MNNEMLRIIDAISRDRNVSKESLFYDIEQAMISAARKHFGVEDVDEFTCKVDRLTGEIKIYQGLTKISLESLGRIPAQTAKQVMIQKFREDERASIFDEYTKRIGEIITGTAQRYEGGTLVVNIGRAEGFMPRNEQISGEQHTPGERVRCMISNVREVGNQVKIILSRSSPEFIRRLFEVEVPEVTERIIEIKALAREPGHRTKVAVASIDSKVDAVGACVGVRGSRIKNIVDELGGEKIDIVRWNESSQVLISNALRPAEVVEISLCFELGRATVVTNEDQLSLAIGKRGQNVRLAARLTGWDVDILTPPEFSKGLDILEQTLKSVEGMSDDLLDRMVAMGFISVFDIEEVGVTVLVDQLNEAAMTPELAQRCVETCSIKGKTVAEQQQRDKEEADIKKKAAAAASAAEEGDAKAGVLDILGIGGDDSSEKKAESEAAPDAQESVDLVDMLVSRQADVEPADEKVATEPQETASEDASVSTEPEEITEADEITEAEDKEAQSSTETEEVVDEDTSVSTEEDSATKTSE